MNDSLALCRHKWKRIERTILQLIMANHHNICSSRVSLLFAQGQASSAGSHLERCENWWESALASYPTRSANSARSISSLHRLAASWDNGSTTWRRNYTERCICAARSSWDFWRSCNCSARRPDSRVERLNRWAMDTSTSCLIRSEECSIYGQWPRSIVHRKSNIE